MARCIRIPQHWGLSNDPEDEIIVRGMMVHEALGHGRFTDFKVWVRSSTSTRSPISTQRFHNILEDIFIETMAMASKPGTKNNLSELVRVLVDTQISSGPSPVSSLKTKQPCSSTHCSSSVGRTCCQARLNTWARAQLPMKALPAGFWPAVDADLRDCSQVRLGAVHTGHAGADPADQAARRSRGQIGKLPQPSDSRQQGNWRARVCPKRKPRGRDGQRQSPR